ncbi:MAG: hypothetical protein CVU18_07920 [Betaproteobacteria bacterium HGW-Betaproteobacteria-12]|nr:MAG: hypothetical protein CVU18_07920 [Betaproteobacteria bacterium HGW-Betaproteobacteria-12]
MEDLKALESLGFTLPTPAYLIGAILFGMIGIVAYRHGRKTSIKAAKWIGIALMLFPYAIAQTWLLYAVGAGLCVALFVFRN